MEYRKGPERGKGLGADGKWPGPEREGDLWVSGGVGLGVPGDKIGRRDPLGVGEQN